MELAPSVPTGGRRHLDHAGPEPLEAVPVGAVRRDANDGGLLLREERVQAVVAEAKGHHYCLGEVLRSHAAEDSEAAGSGEEVPITKVLGYALAAIPRE
jgi:hypothetical protein